MAKGYRCIHWTNREYEWLRENFTKLSYREIIDEHNRVFPDRQRTQGSIARALSRMDCRKRPYVPKFTKVEEAWLLENGDLDYKELGRRFRIKFKSSRSNHSVYAKLWRLRGRRVV